MEVANLPCASPTAPPSPPPVILPSPVVEPSKAVTTKLLIQMTTNRQVIKKEVHDIYQSFPY